MMTTRKRNQFIVRAIRSESELTSCTQLDHTYETDHVWQMDLREELDGNSVRFRTVRLPRAMDVEYPHDNTTRLPALWPKRECFLLALSDEIVLGYVNMQVGTLASQGWIRDLVVDKAVRRRRIGSALLEQAERWATLHNIRHIILEMQTKNFGAMQFARARGFTFCGFNDHYYANHDIAVYFSKTL